MQIGHWASEKYLTGHTNKEVTANSIAVQCPILGTVGKNNTNGQY